MKEKKFRIELGSYVVIGVTSRAAAANAVPALDEKAPEGGKVIGRAEYLGREDLYYVRYHAGDGRLVEAWWEDNALYNLGAENEVDAVGPAI